METSAEKPARWITQQQPQFIFKSTIFDTQAILNLAQARAEIVYGGSADDVLSGADGGAGIDLIELHGHLEDYSLQHIVDLSPNGAYTDFDNVFDYLNYRRGGRWLSSYAPISAGTWIITDHKNLDGSPVAQGQTSNRDGVQTLRHVEKFSYKRDGQTTVLSFATWAPLPVNDRITVNGSGPISINASTLLANDLSFLTLNGATSLEFGITWVGDAVGGSVSLSADRKTITFTPTQGDTGPAEFNYQVRDYDARLNRFDATILQDTNDPSRQGEAKGKVLLTPAITPNTPLDPDYARQWYLGAINAPAAWADGITGRGVSVLILEPAGPFAVANQVADLNTPDLIANISADFIDTADHSVHATEIAGVIGAARNTIGGVGVAYNVTLDSHSFAPAGSTLSAWGETLSAMRHDDVINNSWVTANPWADANFTSAAAAQHSLLSQAIQDAAINGRHGLGTVVIFAAGNDRAKGDDAGLNIGSANPYAITVGAINRVDDIGSNGSVNIPFSERGANILVSAPGSNITTTGVQVTTADGATIGSTSAETQGTSFAAPIVSGVVALMLQANPNLTYRDVQTILALTAKQTFGAGTQADTVWYTNHDTDWNGTGLHYSHDFGFGLVDAAAAVRVADSDQHHSSGSF